MNTYSFNAFALLTKVEECIHLKIVDTFSIQYQHLLS